jgi:hypothetical protein
MGCGCGWIGRPYWSAGSAGADRHNLWLGPESRPSGDGHIRVSDAERSAVADQLQRHFADGRLTQDELTGRLASVWAAKTRAELRACVYDLPAPELVRSNPAAVPPRPRHVALPVLLAAVLVAPSLLVGTAVAAVAFMSYVPVLFFIFVAVLLIQRSTHGWWRDAPRGGSNSGGTGHHDGQGPDRWFGHWW